MKAKNNPEPKKYKLIGKGYFDYLEVEFKKGKMSIREVNYWKEVNLKMKKEKEGLPTFLREVGNTKRLIPYNS